MCLPSKNLVEKNTIGQRRKEREWEEEEKEEEEEEEEEEERGVPSAYSERATCLTFAGLLGLSFTALWKSSSEAGMLPSCRRMRPGPTAAAATRL